MKPLAGEWGGTGSLSKKPDRPDCFFYKGARRFLMMFLHLF